MSKNIRIKPGKGQSTIGVIAGILFCIIGVVIAIPTFGLFGVIWTLFALGITILNGMNAFSDKGFATHEIEIEDRIEEQKTSVSYLEQSPRKGSVQERLKLIEDLYAEGRITKEEFDQKRKKILDEI